VRVHKIISGHNQSVVSIAYHPNGRRLLSANYDRALHLWDLERRTISLSPDGKTLASGSADETIRLWETQVDKMPPYNLTICIATAIVIW
jgi:WD40 repeat protein